MNGLFVALEGICGSGKTTQCRALRASLDERGLPTVDARTEAEVTKQGQALRRMVADKDMAGTLPPAVRALLVAADRAFAVHTVIRPALACGAVVVADRYHLTNYVNQGLTCGVGGTAVQMLETVANGGLLPDLTVILDCPADVALKRIERPDYWEEQGPVLLERMRLHYVDAADCCPSRTTVVIDGARSQDAVAQDIRRLVSALLEVR